MAKDAIKKLKKEIPDGVSFLHFIFSFSACPWAFGTRIWTRLVSVAALAKHVAQYQCHQGNDDFPVFFWGHAKGIEILIFL